MSVNNSREIDRLPSEVGDGPNGVGIPKVPSLPTVLEFRLALDQTLAAPVLWVMFGETLSHSM